MSERIRSDSVGYPRGGASSSTRMATDLTPRKTMFIVAIVLGCFAVLWPKVFYPMLVGSAHQHMKPSAIDRTGIKQERPTHLKAEMIHPAFRERGRAIPQLHESSPSRPPPRIVEGRPGPIPGLRPTIGGPGHVVQPSKQGTSSMSVIMPIYTIGIVIFFTYTLMKILFKKQPDGVGGSLYPPVEPDEHFRREVFESEKSQLASRLARDGTTSKLVVNAMSALLDEVDHELEARRRAKEASVAQDEHLANGKVSNGSAVLSQQDDQPSVTVMGMEMTASCEDGQRWTQAESPVIPTPHYTAPAEPEIPPQEIFLEGALPPESQLLVSDSAIETQKTTEADPAVVLAGKMTLSVVSLDNIGDEGEEVDSQHQPVDGAIGETKAEAADKNIEVEHEDLVAEEIEIAVDGEKELSSNILSSQAADETLNQDAVAKETVDSPDAETFKQKKEESGQKDQSKLETLEVESKLELEKQIDALIQEAKDSLSTKVEDDIELEDDIEPKLRQSELDEFELLRGVKEKDVTKLLHEFNEPLDVEKREVASLDKIGTVEETFDDRSEANTLQEVSNIEDEAAPIEDSNKLVMQEVFDDDVLKVDTEVRSDEQRTDEEILDSEEELEERLSEVDYDIEGDIESGDEGGIGSLQEKDDDDAGDVKEQRANKGASVLEKKILQESEGETEEEEVEEEEEEEEEEEIEQEGGEEIEVEEIVYVDDEEGDEDEDMPNEERDSTNHLDNNNENH